MSKFVFTPELTKDDARRIIDALIFQAECQQYESQVSKVAFKLRNKELITRLGKLARITCPPRESLDCE